ncbi:MAG: hypothetical protein U0L97_03785 [Candidatus Saccharimonadaceae bacterium]|nr:hypothetical protein [Candidatus Saccharimonadaceae bacterium]
MKDKKTINNKIEEFDQCVDWFYSDEFDLDEVEERYKKAIALAEGIQKDLSKLKNNIEILEKDFTK